MKRPWQAREFSTVVILVLEMLFFTWWLWPEPGRGRIRSSTPAISC